MSVMGVTNIRAEKLTSGGSEAPKGFLIHRSTEKPNPSNNHNGINNHKNYTKYLELRIKNLHKMKSIPVCKFDGKTTLETDKK